MGRELGIVGLIFFLIPFVGWAAAGWGIAQLTTPWFGMDPDRWMWMWMQLSPPLVWLLLATPSLFGIMDLNTDKLRRRAWLVSYILPFIVGPIDRYTLALAPIHVVSLAFGYIVFRVSDVNVWEKFQKGWRVANNIVLYNTPWEPDLNGTKANRFFANLFKAAEVYTPDGMFLLGVAQPQPLNPDLDPWVHKVIKAKRWLMTLNPWSPYWGRSAHFDYKTAPIMRANLDGHILIMAPTGSGKGVAYALPQCADWDRGSLVIVDPKRENIDQVRRHRETVHGNKIYVMDPTDRNTDSCDVMGHLDPTDQRFMMMVKNLVGSLMTKSSDAKSDGGNFFGGRAETKVAAVIMFLIAVWYYNHRFLDDPTKNKRPSIGKLYSVLFQPTEDVAKYFANAVAMIEHAKTAALGQGKSSEVLGPFTEAILGNLSSFVGNEPETFSKTLQSVHKELWWLADPAIRRMISGEIHPRGKGKSFTFADLVDDRITVSFAIDNLIQNSTPGLLRLLMGASLAAVFAKGMFDGKPTTLFFADELVGLGPMPIITGEGGVLQIGRSYGICLVGVIQGPTIYEKACGEGVFKIWDQAGIKVAFGMGNAPDITKPISEMLGESTERISDPSTSSNLNAARGGLFGSWGGSSTSHAVKYEKRMLMEQGELSGLPDWYAVVLPRKSQKGIDEEHRKKAAEIGNKPMIVRMLTWFDHPDYCGVRNEAGEIVRQGKIDPPTSTLERMLRTTPEMIVEDLIEMLEHEADQRLKLDLGEDTSMTDIDQGDVEQEVPDDADEVEVDEDDNFLADGPDEDARAVFTAVLREEMRGDAAVLLAARHLYAQEDSRNLFDGIDMSEFETETEEETDNG